MRNENIKISTTIPSLVGRIHIDVDEPSDKAYWYIRFNIALDKDSVSKITMNVTDTDGYLMRTHIDYDDKENLIVIVPLDSYEQNRFYLLNISKQVRSAKGQQLKHDIHILFKLLNDKISQFEILKRTVKVPKPRPRPADYDKKNTAAKVYAFEKESGQAAVTPSDTLPFADMKVNFILGVVGLLAVLASVLIGNRVFAIMSALLCAAGIFHIIYQISRRSFLSAFNYNRGVMEFNKERYDKAELLFKKAASLDVNNEYAELALNRVGFYLNKRDI